MEFIMTREEHKAFVKHLWDHTKEEQEFTEKMEELGFNLDGTAGLMFAYSWNFLRHLTPAEALDNDDFNDEFFAGRDFDAFYEKWY